MNSLLSDVQTILLALYLASTSRTVLMLSFSLSFSLAFDVTLDLSLVRLY